MKALVCVLGPFIFLFFSAFALYLFCSAANDRIEIAEREGKDFLYLDALRRFAEKAAIKVKKHTLNLWNWKFVSYDERMRK